MRIIARGIGFVVAVGTALFIAACGGSDSGGGKPTASGTVGPAGGSVASADGRVALTVPAGALAAPTAIRITELSGSAVPQGLRALAPAVLYRLEPSGTTFATPARLEVRLPPSAAGELAVLVLESNGILESPANMSLTMSGTERVLAADVPHFSTAFVRSVTSMTATLAVAPSSTQVGKKVDLTFTLAKTAGTDSAVFTPGVGFRPSVTSRPVAFAEGSSLATTTFNAAVAHQISESRQGTCVQVGSSSIVYEGFVGGLLIAELLEYGHVDEITFSVFLTEPVACTQGDPPPGGVVATGLFSVPGISAPDGLNLITGAFANLSGTNPKAAIAGAEGVKVVDLVTHEVALDRSAAGPEGATLGTNALGVLAVAAGASASAPAAMIGYGTGGAFVQNHHPTQSWGLSSRDFELTFDVVTAANSLVASTVALVRPLLGIAFVALDTTSMTYRSDPSRSVPYSAFPGTSNLVSAQMPDGAAGHLLVLGRAAGGGSTATSTKVFYKNVNDAQTATTLLSLGSVEARRLRCIPVGARQACVVGVTGSGQGMAFLFDPASPTATPRVTTITAAAGTLGVALTSLPNGHVGVVMANYTANSLTVAELSADLETIHSSSTTAAPAGCPAVAHVELLADSEGIKAVTTCNGSGNYWVSKPFGN